MMSINLRYSKRSILLAWLLKSQLLEQVRDAKIIIAEYGMLVKFKKKKPLGNDLLSQGVAPQVPSALTGLTTGFGMWPGVPPSLQSPRDLILRC